MLSELHNFKTAKVQRQKFNNSSLQTFKLQTYTVSNFHVRKRFIKDVRGPSPRAFNNGPKRRSGGPGAQRAPGASLPDDGKDSHVEDGDVEDGQASLMFAAAAPSSPTHSTSPQPSPSTHPAYGFAVGLDAGQWPGLLPDICTRARLRSSLP